MAHDFGRTFCTRTTTPLVYLTRGESLWAKKAGAARVPKHRDARCTEIERPTPSPRSLALRPNTRYLNQTAHGFAPTVPFVPDTFSCPGSIMKLLHFVVLACLSACSAAADDRPNILFAIADDWGWPHAGAYGDPVVKTPTFDRLVARALCFSTPNFVAVLHTVARRDPHRTVSLATGRCGQSVERLSRQVCNVPRDARRGRLRDRRRRRNTGDRDARKPKAASCRANASADSEVSRKSSQGQTVLLLAR